MANGIYLLAALTYYDITGVLKQFILKEETTYYLSFAPKIFDLRPLCVKLWVKMF